MTTTESQVNLVVDKMNISTSVRELLRGWHNMLSGAVWTRAKRKQIYRLALQRHAHNRKAAIVIV